MREPKDIHILVVDDEESLRKAIIFDFKRKGFVVTGAENGTQAFEIVKNNRIDVVLTDVRMPGGDGIELLDKVKALNPELPVVMFITGFADITLDEAYDRGVDAVFAKPFDRKALLAAVLRTMGDKDEKWSSRTAERIETDLNIVLHFSDLGMAVEGNVMNVGRGGIFVSLKDKFPTAESKVSFDIKFGGGQPGRLQGNGIVRWIRIQENPGRPAGCGIEFEYLSDDSRKQVITFINNLKTKAFIPKT